jgi:hypothetical protein
MATTVDEYGNIVDEPIYSFDPWSGDEPVYGGTVPGGVNTTFDPWSGEQPVDGGTFTPGGIGTLGGGSDITSAINKLFGTNMTGKQLAALAGIAGGGIAGLVGGLNPTTQKVGYQGSIPKYDAVRNMVNAPAAGRRPGAGGTRYGGDVSFVPKGSTPTGGLASLVNSGILGGTPPVDANGNPAPTFNPSLYEFYGGVNGRSVSPSDMIKAVNTAPVVRDVDAPEVMRMVNPNQTAVAYAGGGLASGRYLQGETDGMADKIPAQIGKDQPAALSHGEFVIPADVVSHLGNGNSDAGAKKLYSMMDKIREARTGTKKQGKKINPDKFMPGGLAQAYASGGGVKGFAVGGDTGVGTAAAAGVTGTEQAPSTWAGDYITNMLGKGQALSEMPYQEYGGPLTAGASSLQDQAFNTAANLSVPASVGTAAQTAGDIATKAQNINYAPTTFDNQFKAPEQTAATNFTNQYQAPTPYQNTNFTAGTFGNEQAQQYMNPYLQQSLNPQLAEARRQADITEQQNKAAMTKAGAFGGGRQAILTAEGQRNLGTNLSGITGKGYDTAYQNAMSQFNADQARNMQAQQASEQSKQFGAQQGMTAAQMMAQYGMSAQQAQEAARQFQQNQAMTGAQSTAQYGLAGQQAGEASRQFGANLGLQGLNTGLQAAQTQGNLGISGADLGLRQLQEQERLGATQRGIESEGIAADKAAFEQARDNPYKMVQFQQSLLNGLPITATNYNLQNPNWLSAAAGGATTAADLISILSGNAPAKKI